MIFDRKRNLEWWREDKEVPVTNKLREAYDQGGFKPGWDGVTNGGKDGQPVIKNTGYAKAGGDAKKNYDRLGPGKKTSKSSDPLETDYPTVKEKRIVKAKSVKEAFEDEEFDDDLGGDEFAGDAFEGEDEGFGDDGVPGEFEDEGLEDEGMGGADAEDIVVEVGGQSYKLVPLEDELGGEGLPGEGDEFGGDDFSGEEFGAEDDLGDEDFGPEEDEELGRHGGMKAEKKDVTTEQKKRKVSESKDSLDRVIENALRKNAIKKALAEKAMAEKKLKELFTGEYVLNKQGEPGFDFTDVGGETDFAVVDRAASGNQYSPTVSTSVYEPGKDKKGGKTGHAKTVESKKAEFEKWLKKQESSFKEEGSDPGQDSKDFNQNDKGVETKDEWSDTPEKIGGRPAEELLTKGTGKTYEDVKKERLARRTESVKTPSKEVKETLEDKMTESFDFKAFLKGEYTK